MQCHKYWLEAKELAIVINAQTKSPLFTTHPNPSVATTHNSSNSRLVCIHKLSLKEMVECQRLCLCYNCDEKYFEGHKKNINYHKWMYLHMTTQSTFSLKILLSRNPKFFSIPYEAKYFLTFINTFSSFLWVYAIKSKDAICGMFWKFKSLVENQSNGKMKCLNCNSRGDYINNAFY